MFNNSKITVGVTVLMIVMVFVLPWLDRTICKKLGLNLNDGISSNPNAARLLRLRKVLLTVMFVIYLLVLLYTAFFSRTASDDYKVHVALYQDLANSIKIDYGILQFIKAIFTDGFQDAMTHVRIHLDDINQVYLNMVMFVPMGYLLPYIFDYFRKKVHYRPVLACLIFSVLIENIQLITRLGFYDVDDIFSNVIGGFIGQRLYIVVAYVLTHPDWRKDIEKYRNWKRKAMGKTLYPYLGKLGVTRTTIYATDEKAIWDFYVDKLGFRVLKKNVVKDSKITEYLFAVGRNQVEIICYNEERNLPEQYLAFTFNNLDKLKDRLVKEGIDDGIYEKDKYSDLRLLRFKGPDEVNVVILEGE